jgi:hypothetical protein
MKKYLYGLLAMVVVAVAVVSYEQTRNAKAEHGLRELVAARNLRIIDIYDFDAGSRKKETGRIFYTEGKFLLFYVYDLGQSRKFYVWGSNRDGNVHNLGTLDEDDLPQGRWKLQVDDTRLLADVSRIFVTAEPHSQGKKILSAYL